MPEPDDTSRLDRIFARAREITDPTQRAVYLDEACARDKALRTEIESLLAADRGAADFMKLETLALSDAMPGAKPGDHIGRYKLLEKIGEGGFGEVWMAEQEEPVRRRVAFKIIKLGMDTKEVVARFEAERQALALMEHPNIARVFDGGATEGGRPYFVMELVRGVPITDYCDQNNLPTGQRLQLFIRVCQAVQHAHQKGIIHRDIKPSNVLVTLHDGEPVPKVIDFGIAKALGQKLTEKTFFTAFRQMIGTPAYMSPEQAEMSGLDIDTRSDIYSLGVLLYELLTGVTPFDKETLARAALDEIRRMIRETEPLKPSTRLRTLGEKVAEVAKRRHTEPMALSRLVRGDLDWIAMKCLEKDRARRYETANGVAADVKRFLQNEPITAAAPTLSYRWLKFARRHRVALTTVAGFVLVLLTATGVSIWEAVRATRAREREATQASQSRQIAKFLQEMLEGVQPSVALGRDTTMLREILDKAAQRVGKELSGQPQVEAELRTTLGGVYEELGEYAKAEAMMREALALRKKVFGSKHSEVAKSLNGLGVVLLYEDKLNEAESAFREALAIERTLPGTEDRAVASDVGNLGGVLLRRGKVSEAEGMLREAMVLHKKLASGKDTEDVAHALNNLALLLYKEGKLDDAEPMFRESLAMKKRLLGNEHPDVALSLGVLAGVLQARGNLEGAEGLTREALAMQRKLLGNEHPDIAKLLNNLAWLRWKEGDLAEAEKLARDSLAMFRKLLGTEIPDAAVVLDTLACVLRDAGRVDEAETLFREGLTVARKGFGDVHPCVAELLGDYGMLLLREEHLTNAEPSCDRRWTCERNCSAVNILT